ncbi:6,7-dimethyl-8-ribityllumazine synthase [bacterium endosymbiont of Pedicinus badii]|uniref:6,7-dimethyl-8-ribityllumazine synthase n=1 Tax=bacterium endosymbiont of Pedicinus badii TaxID=1719126 RepID=UPI0009BC1A75|nr:6,7-dimethyl-8-ribityllumazine synthase [bacterium endosymbiont of Pedicinus badii]OQM34285.1 hypothetical protein AOQ89_00075 [bacterium endosymbiont of Pedicinus badii]
MKYYLNQKDFEITIIAAKFNKFINEKLIDGAKNTLINVGKISNKNIKKIWVPGVYEIPLICDIVSEKKKSSAVIAIASIIEGETKHAKYIAQSCFLQISNISVKYQIPISCAILTVKNLNQAFERSGGKFGNRGSEAAYSVLEMIDTIEKIK